MINTIILKEIKRTVFICSCKKQTTHLLEFILKAIILFLFELEDKMYIYRSLPRKHEFLS